MNVAFSSTESRPLDDFEIMDRIEQCMRDYTKSLAINIAKKNRQAVLMRISLDETTGTPKYTIIYGIPEKSDRHGLGEEGFLHEPVEKVALTEAIRKNEIIVIHDAPRDPRTRYMIQHIRNKNILSLAVMPIVYENEVKYLIVIDKVPPSEAGFTEKEVKFLRDTKKSLEETRISCAKYGIENDLFNLILKMQNGLGHEIRNRLHLIGPFAKRIKKALPPELGHVADYADIIINEIKRCDNNLNFFSALIKHILPTAEKEAIIPVDDILSHFQGNNFILSSVNGHGRRTVKAIPSRANALFGELKKYLESSAVNGNGDRTLIEVELEGSFIKIFFSNKSFGQVSSTLELFEYLANIMNGWIDFRDGSCLIALPLND